MRQVFDKDFKAGFEQGYRLIAGNTAFLPFTPFPPFTPFGSTPFREGIKAGVKAAGFEISKPLRRI